MKPTLFAILAVVPAAGLPPPPAALTARHIVGQELRCDWGYGTNGRATFNKNGTYTHCLGRYDPTLRGLWRLSGDRLEMLEITDGRFYFHTLRLKPSDWWTDRGWAGTASTYKSNGGFWADSPIENTYFVRLSQLPAKKR